MQFDTSGASISHASSLGTDGYATGWVFFGAKIAVDTAGTGFDVDAVIGDRGGGEGVGFVDAASKGVVQHAGVAVVLIINEPVTAACCRLADGMVACVWGGWKGDVSQLAGARKLVGHVAIYNTTHMR